MRPRSPLISRHRRSYGFTVAEVVVAGCLLALFVSTAVGAMGQINRWAAGARLRTLALAAAQQRLDDALTTPWQVGVTRPTSLTAGTVTETTVALNNDTFNDTSGLSSTYTTLDTPINATRVTTITDITTRIFRVSVTVSFTYRSRSYSVNLTSLRTTDSI